MEEPYKNSEQLMKGWIQEAGLEKPSAAFELKILEKIEAGSIVQKATPLISKTGWFILSFIFATSIVVMYLYPSELISFEGNRISDLFGKIESLKTLSISKTTQYAFLFLALFLVQLPFLKYYLEKQRF